MQNNEEVSVDRSDLGPVASAYQILNTSTIEYLSLYSRPRERKEGDAVPEIEVEGEFYAVVDKNKTDQHVYTPLSK